MLFFIILFIIVMFCILLWITVLGMGKCFDAKEEEISEILAFQNEISEIYNKGKNLRNEENDNEKK